MITSNAASTPVRALVQAWLTLARQHAGATGEAGLRRLKVFLDCDEWLEDEMRSEHDLVSYVDDRENADVCMSVTPDSSHGSVRHYLVEFTGAGRFAFIEASARLHLPRRRIVGLPDLDSSESATA